jgi:hypothetical protein
MSIFIVLPLSPLSLAWVCGWDMNASKQREVQSNFSHFPSYLIDYAGKSGGEQLRLPGS